MADSIDAGVLNALHEYVVKVDSDDSNLSPVADALADATVIGMGESTHGTHEHFQIKADLFRQLATDHGIRLFGLEANYSETLAVDRYVRSTDDAPESAADALAATYFWPWYVTELADLVDWMKTFNAGRPAADQIRFFGFDSQYAVGGAEALSSFLSDADPDLLAEHRATLDTLADWGLDTDDDEVFDSRIEDAQAFIQSFRERLDERRKEYVDATGEQAVRHAELHYATMADAVDVRAIDDVDVEKRRDRAMADGVDRLFDTSQHDQIALWAHNFHIQRTPHEREGKTIKRSGSHLADRYGDDYAALGFSFTEGSFQAMAQDDDEYGLRDCVVKPASEGSVGEILGRLDGSLLFLDIQDAPADAHLDSFLRAERSLRNFGGMYPRNEFEPDMVLADAFDALIHVDETTRAVPLGHPSEIFPNRE